MRAKGVKQGLVYQSKKKKECQHPDCDWVKQTGMACGRHKEWERDILKKEKELQ